MHGSLINEATTYKFVVCGGIFHRYLRLPFFFLHILSGESYITVLQNLNSAVFKRDSVPVPWLVIMPTATGFYLSILFSRSQVVYRGN